MEKFRDLLSDLTHGLIHKKSEVILAFIVIALVIILLFSIIVKFLV